MQLQPNVLWNQLLSWLYIQQRDYSKAFAQEKAIFLREQESLSGILDLVNVTLKEDLKRRDLTINAMALDKNNEIIDIGVDINIFNPNLNYQTLRIQLYSDYYNWGSWGGTILSTSYSEEYKKCDPSLSSLFKNALL